MGSIIDSFDKGEMRPSIVVIYNYAVYKLEHIEMKYNFHFSCLTKHDLSIEITEVHSLF